MRPIKGSIVALVTPFHEDGSVNFEKLKELLDLAYRQFHRWDPRAGNDW